MFLGGRGSGKSYAAGALVYRCMSEMPRSRGFLAGPDETMLFNLILPSMQDAWKRMGLQKHTNANPGHYVVGRKPPAHWPSSYSEIEDYSRAITFCNGTVLEILSFYKKNAGRGGNYQWGFVDEAALIDEDVLKKAASAALRAEPMRLTRMPIPKKMPVNFGKCVQLSGQWYWEFRWKDNPMYRGLFCMTTQPWLKSGAWTRETKNDSKWDFFESTAYDNLDALGGIDYIEDLRTDLPDLIFRVEVMNEEINAVVDGYYPYLDELKHLYTGDIYDPNKELLIGMDFNAGFNSMIIGQEIGGVLYIFKVLWVKGNLVVSDLMRKFCEVFANHKYKSVEIYGDQTGNNKSAVNNMTAFETVEQVLREHGWKYYRPVTGRNPGHKRRHEVINGGMMEREDSKQPPVRIHRDECKSLVISMTLAPIRSDFSKDKTSEQRKSVRDEDATHLSDCYDYLYFGKYQHKAPVIGGSSGIDLYIG